MSDPICDMCGGECVHDRREGHVVCTDCGGVLEEWTTGDDRYEAMARVTYADVREVKKRKIDRHGGMKAKIASLVDHAGMGAAITASCSNMIDMLPPGRLRDRDLDAWALISLACELCKSCRSIKDLAQQSGASAGRLIATRESLREDLKSLFDDSTAVDGVDETLTAMNSVLSSIFAASDCKSKLAARRHVLRRSIDVADNAAFMNMRPATRARVLVAEHLRSIGHVPSAADREALMIGSTGVRNGLKKLLSVPVSEPPPTV
jgi:hypothetical protein